MIRRHCFVCCGALESLKIYANLIDIVFHTIGVRVGKNKKTIGTFFLILIGMQTPIDCMHKDGNLQLKHPVITKSDNDITAIRMYATREVLKHAQEQRKSVSLSQEGPSKESTQHPNSQHTSPVLLNEIHAPRIAILPQIAIPNMNNVSSDGGMTPLGGTPREGGQVGQVRNFVGTNLETSISFLDDHGQDAVIRFRTMLVDQDKKISKTRDISQQTSRNVKYVACCVCLSYMVMCVLSLTGIGLGIAILARQK